MDFAVNGRAVGTNDSELHIAGGPKTVTVTGRAAAYLPAEQDEVGAAIAARPLTQPPYWHIERARIGTGRTVPVELIVNGEAVDRVEIEAEGK